VLDAGDRDWWFWERVLVVVAVVAGHSALEYFARKGEISE